MEFEQFKDLLRSDRSVRRFYEQKIIGNDTLRQLVALTRFCASGRNLQPLRYRIVTSQQERDALFPALAWAGYFKDWDGPVPGERPAAYLVQCLDTDLTQALLCDDGLQLQAITLGARTLGLGCCIIKAFNAEKVKSVLALPDNMKPLYVLAIGVPREEVVIEDLTDPCGNIEYFRTPDGVHHVPKRTADQLLIK